MSYFPVDRDILSSSLWAQGTPEQVKIWFYLLLAADPRTGIVEDADPAIAMRCALPLDVTMAALDWLAAPDAYSRTKDNDGRRIERLPNGGIRVLNYVRHRDKDYSTPRWRRWKERQQEATNEQTPANGVGNDEHEHEQEHTDTPLTPLPGGGAGRKNGNGTGTSTARELQRLEADPALADVADAWVRAFKRPRRELGVLRAARTAVAGGYEPDVLKLVVRVCGAAREAPERFPDRGFIRWAVEHGKAGDPSYLLRPSTIDRLIPEAETWDRAEADAGAPQPKPEPTGPVFCGPRKFA